MSRAARARARRRRREQLTGVVEILRSARAAIRRGNGDLALRLVVSASFDAGQVAGVYGTSTSKPRAALEMLRRAVMTTQRDLAGTLAPAAARAA